jgi:FAD/FMN-containing dehydrogenase/Fe-S oxidoreductase
MERSSRFTRPGRQRETRIAPNIDAAGLRTVLEENVAGEVRFGDGDRALYAADASNYRHVPIGVVIPRSTEDVERAIAICRGFGAPVLARGGGTSLGGQSCNVAVVMDFSKHLDGVLEIDEAERRARVRPGTVLDRLREATERHGLTFGPDPATHRWCTVGGMIGNNSCGVHSVLSEFYGPGARTEDQVLELDVLTYDGLRLRVGPTSDEEYARIVGEGGRRGEIYSRLRALRDRYGGLIRERFPDIPRRVSGYNLPALLPENGFDLARALVGSECTCVTILEATVALVPTFPNRTLVVLGYPSVFEAGDHVPEIREHRPVGLEGMDTRLARFMEKKGLRTEHLDHLPEGGGWLLVEFGGHTQEEADERAHGFVRSLRGRRDAPAIEVYSDPEVQAKVWEIRESGLGATAFVPGEPDAWPGWEDSAVPPDRVGEYLRDLRGLFDKYDYHPSLYGHFGQGCIHTRIDFDFGSEKGIQKYRAFTREAAELVVTHYGGSLSGEHGDGQARGDLLPLMFGEELMEAFREFKSIWDPDWKMNPGKVIDALPRDADLRIGVGFRPPPVETHFRYPHDEGSFARATMRCVGVGQCRKTDGGTMCPSFMVLREEKHTTRGRAHLLFEMLQGDPISEGWRDESVRESLRLCLSCKGCKGECPVNVDIATYKAEFLSRYYGQRLRPLNHYLFGNIDLWSRLASVAPAVANFTTQTPALSRVLKAAANVPAERRIPAFAPRTFRSWWKQRPPLERRDGQEVVLWADTFNNHFHPTTAAAAVEVLEDAGCRVCVPEASLCCGRPLYEFGMLDRAKRLLGQILQHLRPQIRAGTPVVGLEPSCVAVFRDELVELFPDDDDARRLSEQVFTLAEFLQQLDYEPPRLRRRALLHGHCHDKAVLGFGAEPELLSRLGLDVEVLDSGCCGMAGAFGFEKDKYDVSIGAGERVLLPAVRNADPNTLIVADGFSCREQIDQQTDRKALHVAEVLQLALHARSEAGRVPEQQPQRFLPELSDGTTSALSAGVRVAGAFLLGGVAGVGVAYALSTGRQGRRG